MTIVKFQRGITTKLYRQELRSLCFTRRLMMLYTCISMQFHENILKVFFCFFFFFLFFFFFFFFFFFCGFGADTK